jgi:glycosyltransferase involved in cell wall biosynthesis
MRIVIDLQGAQTESHKRGIGRYSLAIAQAIARARHEHDIVLALNGRFRDRNELIRASFDGLLQQDKIRIFDVPGHVRAVDPDTNEWRRKAELIREAFLADLNPDFVLLTSLFEGYMDDAVTSIGRLAQGSWQTATILYDLIPLAFPRLCLADTVQRAWYKEKIEDLTRADLFLAISEHSRSEGIKHLKLDARQVTNISAAVEQRFRRLDLSTVAREACFALHGITRPFVLYAGGFDSRKNVERAIRAFALLPVELRWKYQLVLAGGIEDVDKFHLQTIARQAGLGSTSCVFTGRIDDDGLINLYNLCTAFIFPSLQEGFGLPALEAMACGAPTIASNASSLPEVVGLNEALFDPKSEADICRLLERVLADEAFRGRLRAHGLERAHKFSWNTTARRLLDAVECKMTDRKSIPAACPDSRPRLAFVSPLPPERTGIADYSAELLPKLAEHYEIVLIADQKKIDTEAIGIEFPVRDPSWLRANSGAVDRIVYQMGNSPFHNYMRDLIVEIPGTVVLHDFFLSGLFSWLEQNDSSRRAWTQALYQSHGYLAVRDRYKIEEAAKISYPVNFGILQAAQGVIVHSEHARILARDWLGPGLAENWKVIPQLHTLAASYPRATARDALGLPQDAFVICTFGLLDPLKLNHRLIDAFLASSLMRDAKCHLIFVGENHGGDYGKGLLEIIRKSGLSNRIRITGWVDPLRFGQLLAAGDVAVQLRTGTRGETSRTVLDCLSAGLSVITNSHGSQAELPADAVWMLGDEFSNMDLIIALETLRHDGDKRDALRRRAREVIATHHAPEVCARQYAEAVEAFHAAARTGLPALLDSIAGTPPRPDEAGCRVLSQAIARSLPTKMPARQLLLDVSATCCTELKTGIERVAHALIVAFVEAPPKGFRIEPVYLSDEGGVWHYRYARRFTLNLLGCPPDPFADDPVEPQAGDMLLGLDNSGRRLIEAEAAGLFADYRGRGVAMYFIVYDLLPLQLPQYFPPKSDDGHERWLRSLLRTDGALCISRTVADDLRNWANVCDPSSQRPFRIGWFHLGGDISSVAHKRGPPEESARDLVAFTARPSFLMVGTIEPRKGHLQVLDAFDELWRRGCDINLIIVGTEGWRHLPEDMRRTIPHIMARLKSHPERGRRLFWVNGPSDEYLEEIYAASSYLIAASEGEGFGLPLIEAARHRLPVISRDLAVFREVLGDHASYFEGDGHALAKVIQDALDHSIDQPAPKVPEFHSWRDAAAQIVSCICYQNWRSFLVNETIRKRAVDQHLYFIQRARIELVREHLPQGNVILDLGDADSRLYQMGYSHRFEKLYMVDPPPDPPQDMCDEVAFAKFSRLGEVIGYYGNITDLDGFADESADLVWAGQSMQYLTPEGGERMCRAAFRVLKEKGAFCFDTPNRLLSRIHPRSSGGNKVHPEDEPDGLGRLLEQTGFVVRSPLGICEMPNTLLSNELSYEDLIYGRSIISDGTRCYLQYFHCVKP